jgi:hypothetical protein
VEKALGAAVAKVGGASVIRAGGNMLIKALRGPVGTSAPKLGDARGVIKWAVERGWVDASSRSS